MVWIPVLVLALTLATAAAASPDLPKRQLNPIEPLASGVRFDAGAKVGGVPVREGGTEPRETQAVRDGSRVFAYHVGDKVECVRLENIYGTRETQCIEKISAGKNFVLVQFFTTSCVDCTENLSKLSLLAKTLKKALDVRLVSLTRSTTRLKRYIEENKDQIHFDVAVDREKQARSLYRFTALPTLLLIDKNQEVVFEKVGVLSAEDIQEVTDLVSTERSARVSGP